MVFVRSLGAALSAPLALADTACRERLGSLHTFSPLSAKTQKPRSYIMGRYDESRLDAERAMADD
jgi:hypothetical protein